MPDSAAVEQEGAAEERYKPGRGVVALMAIPIVGLIILSNIGNAVAPTLVNSHPLALLALNSQNRTLILTTNHLDAWSYYLVGSLRLLVSDPLFFLLGYWYGDTAIDWMEGRTRSLGKAVRQWDHLFRKAAYPIVFVAPNQWVCLFAGGAGMSVTGFFTVNIIGTLARLYAIRWLGQSFQEPIDDVLHWIGHNTWWLLIITIGLAVVFLVSELRQGTGLAELEDMVEEAEADGEAGPG